MKTIVAFCLLVGWVVFWIAMAFASSEKAGMGVATMLIPAAIVGVFAGVLWKEANP